MPKFINLLMYFDHSVQSSHKYYSNKKTLMKKQFDEVKIILKVLLSYMQQLRAKNRCGSSQASTVWKDVNL